MAETVVVVVVVGGGYAGLVAANRLAGRSDARVTLVEPQPRFVERIRLHEYAAGSRNDPTLPWSSVLPAGVSRVASRAERVDAPRRRVILDDGRELPYDYLILATGSGSAERPPGTFSIGNLAEATALRRALDAAPEPLRVTVVGGGLTGVELAAELAEARGDAVQVTLHADTLLPGLSERGGGLARAGLARLGARLGTSSRTTPGETQAGSDLVVWCTGFRAELPALAVPSEGGRARVRPTLQLESDDRILIAGDAGVPIGEQYGHLRMSCAMAMPLGATAANSVAAMLEGSEPAPFDRGYLFQCISLGRRSGIAQYVSTTDQPTRLVAGGRAGAWLKEYLCRFTIDRIRREARRPGSTGTMGFPQLRQRAANEARDPGRHRDDGHTLPTLDTPRAG